MFFCFFFKLLLPVKIVGQVPENLKHFHITLFCGKWLREQDLERLFIFHIL